MWVVLTTSLELFLAFTTFISSLTYGVWLLRRFFQHRVDVMRETYETSFPAEMSDEQVLEFIQAVWSDTPTFRLLSPSQPVLFEKLGDGPDRKYYLSLPHQLHDNVSVLLEAIVDGV